MSDYDVIIIGAGSVGVPTAYFLGKEGMKVLVIEKNASAGQGQNKAAIGGVRATHSDPSKIKTCQKSLEIFSTWKEITNTDIGWKEGGYCFPAYREQDATMMQAILPTQKRFKLNIDWVGDDEVAKVVPGINRNNLLGGTYSPDDGQVSPLMAIESFTHEAKKLGAEFNFREQVIELTMDGNAIKGVKTDRGEYSAPVVVNAAGAYATRICKMAGFNIPVVPDSHEAGISSPVKPWLDPLVVDIRPGPEGKTKNFYFGQVETGQIIFCYTPIDPIIGDDRHSTSEFMPILARRLVDLIPRMKGLTIRRLWRGLYPMTPDGVPIVGKSKMEGFYLGMGMCGQGFMMGPGIGANLANLIAKGQPIMKQSIWDYMRPDRSFKTDDVERLA